MPMYHVTSPDGSTYEVNAPEGASEQDAMDYVQKNQQTLAPVKPTAPTTPAAAPTPAAPAEKTWGEAIMGDAKNSGIGRTGFDQGMQGMTFGFADEVQDRIGALIASTYTGEKYDDMLKMAREASKARLAQQMDQRPALSIGANVAGGLLTGGAGLETSAGKAVASGVRNGVVLGKDLGNAARVAKIAGLGAAQGAAYGAGSANDGERGEGAIKGGVIGGVAGAVAPVVGRGIASLGNYGGSIAKGLVAKAPEEVHDVADALKKIAAGNYDKMRKAGATFNDSAANDLITSVRKNIDSNEFIPELNPKTLAIINKIEDRATDPNAGRLTLSELDQYRRLLGRVGATEDGVSAGAARKAIDDFVTNANAGHLTSGDPAAMKVLLQGRKQYAQASKYEDIADIIAKADGDPNKIKRGLTRFIEVNGNKPAGWGDAEAKALRRAASLGNSEALLRFVGKAGFDLGGTKMVGNITGGTAGYFLSGGNPVVPMVGTAAKEAYKLGTRGQASQLLKMLEKGPQNPGFMPQVYNAAAPYGAVAQRSLTNAGINQAMPGMTPRQPVSPLKRFY